MLPARFLLACIAAAPVLCQTTSIVDSVASPSTTLSTAPLSLLQKRQSQSTSIQVGATQTQPTLATGTSSASALDATSSTTASTTSTASPPATSDYNGSDPSTNNGGATVDTDGGASGSGQSFGISQGGMIAIIVVVVIVAVFGIASTILFVLAKRRQWNIRASIARAAERLATPLTPRFPRTARTPALQMSKRGGGSNRRVTVHAGRFAGSKPTRDEDATPLKPYGHKRGPRVEETDIEKNSTASSKLEERSWTARLMGNDWKS
ncbi:hypothetical protein BAUCODRAFT_342265 [Baudoinia panamericana UAMH 10762]|uniref:Mid2 domain-containing protein n=1 Tax=Baudoinia panamericana (strain UAMH 10762) TaxID=717646 RepID=M2N6A3_BAUPA|nr:uncharacterized protein BAUCODRAFT_342265 [Baudoinia panamericana UAMH 10762]EMC99583.1 hypothetical protein BAUCODRAFT_342265 [Baudoinia panamericana UAMH 10762]